MVKILSQAGQSLADMYDVQGSVAGIDQLRSEEVSLVHEVGSTIFAERLGGQVRRAQTAGINQNAAFDLTIADLPNVAFRILDVLLLTDVASRLDFACISLIDVPNGREVPVWVWDDANDQEAQVRIDENGAGAATRFYHVANPTLLPTMGFGSDQPLAVGTMVCRGATNGFGAGTVTMTALVYVAFAEIGGISSYGVPIPGW